MYDIRHYCGTGGAVGSETQVGVAQIAAVMTTVSPIQDGDQLLFVGVDDRGIELEIIAVPDNRNPETLAVIHAMPTILRKGRANGQG